MKKIDLLLRQAVRVNQARDPQDVLSWARLLVLVLEI